MGSIDCNSFLEESYISEKASSLIQTTRLKSEENLAQDNFW